MEKKADYQISSSVNLGIIEVIITGEITKNTFEKMINDVDVIIKESRVEKALWDLRALNGRFGHADVYSRVRSYTPHFYDIHNAVVDLPEYSEFASVNETKAKNACVSVKWFIDIKDARAWLKSKR